MRETVLIKICAVLVISGLVILGVVVVCMQPIEVEIGRINGSMVGAFVKINASIISISKSDAGHVFMRLGNGNSSIAAVVFASDANVALEKGDRITATGQVSVYRGQLEIILKSIKKE
jgi:DNA/RNA endonuclease YhcR with UshA esterase domain